MQQYIKKTMKHKKVNRKNNTNKQKYKKQTQTKT